MLFCTVHYLTIVCTHFPVRWRRLQYVLLCIGPLADVTKSRLNTYYLELAQRMCHRGVSKAEHGQG
jgi:hypothetical protein